MRDDRRNYIVVGVFVIAMLTALIAWIAVLSGRTGATDPYFIVYRNVMGLQSGTQILYEGFPVGLIESIEPVDGGKSFRVDVSVRRGWRIPTDSQARITASGLLAALAIDIAAGKADTTIEPGGEIPGVESAALLDVVSHVGGEFDSLLENQIVPWVEDMRASTTEMARNLEVFSSDLNESLERVNGVLTPENTDRVGRILANLETSSGNVARVSADLATTREMLDRLVGRLDALIERNEDELGHAVVDAHESLETVARHIDSITHDLEATSRNMSEFSRQIREDPSLLLRGREIGEAAPESAR